MTTSKLKAIQLIQSALKNGWTREVKANRLSPGDKPFAVMVILSSPVHTVLNDYAFIYVSFRRGRRSSVSITTIASYYRNHKNQKGLWNAQYEIRRIAEGK